MVGFQHLQLCDLHIQIHLLLDQRVSGAQSLDLRIGQCLFVHIVAGAYRGFAGHNLADKALFVLKGLEQIRIERTLRNVVEHFDFRVLVSLPDDATVALGHVAGFPADIQMMHCNKTLLHIGSCTHLCGAAQQDAHIAGAHFREQCCLFRFGVGVVDELNFVFWHPGGNQLLANIIVDIEIAIVFGCREVAEQKLRQLLVFTFLPDLQDVPHTDVQLAVRVIREHGVHQADIQTDFSAIVGDTQHIIHGRIHIAGVNLGGASAQFLHHSFLGLGRFYNYRFKLRIRHRQMQLVGSLDVCYFFEHRHQFGQVEELRKSCSGAIPSTFGRKLDGGGGFAKGRCPAVKVCQLLLLEGAVLQVAHDRIQFGHGIADRRTSRKHYAAPTGDLIQIAAFSEHIRRFLCFTGG